VAQAGPDQTVKEDSPVTLDGSASYDPDGESLTYHWVQAGGPAVALSDPAASQPTFAAPLVGQEGAQLTFELTVSDGIDASPPDGVTVGVENLNHPPVAEAGADQTRDEGALVTLDGSGSRDPDGDPLVHHWHQAGGTPVALDDVSSPNPSFTAPPVGPGGETLVFELVVNDGQADSVPDTVSVNVSNVNDPPACSQAQPTSAVLWPPNHRLVAVGITGLGDRVAMAITQVTQDEPVNGLGDGDTSPDAVIQGDTVLLRAERAGPPGNGRVYEVHFSADDGQGGTCTGSVKVVVSHDRRPRRPVVDDGQRYDSTQQ